MATMNTSLTKEASQEDIAREMASAIADDATVQTNTTSSTFEQGELSQSTTSDLSTSGSFIQIAAVDENAGKHQQQQTDSVAVNFEGPIIQDDSSEVISQGVWGWISNAVGSDIVETTQRLGRNLVQKTKDSMDSVITTLDPGMEDYLYKTSKDTINILVTTTDEDVLEGIKAGFKQMFSHVLVQNKTSRSSLALLPNSFSSALKSAKQKISNLCSSHPPEPGVVIIALEEFIAEIMPGMWFGMFALCIEDSMHKIETETFSQAITLPNDVVNKLEELTPSTYSLRWSGLGVTLVDVLQSDWPNFLAGVSKRQVITLAAKTLAGQYRERMRTSSSLLEKSVTL